MIADGEHTQEQGVLEKRTTKYPEGMKEFIEERMETTTNPDLCLEINEKWDLNMEVSRLKSFMKYNKLKRVNIIRAPRIKAEKAEKAEKKNKGNQTKKKNK